MKLLILADGTIYGPFNAAAATDGGILCDGVVLYPFTVIGAGYQIAEVNDAPIADPVGYAADIEARLDNDLDALAVSWGYKNSNRLASYYNDPNPKWQAEARAFVNGRSLWWQTAANIQNAWQPGQPVPTYELVRAQMPAIDRPQ